MLWPGASARAASGTARPTSSSLRNLSCRNFSLRQREARLTYRPEGYRAHFTGLLSGAATRMLHIFVIVNCSRETLGSPEASGDPTTPSRPVFSSTLACRSAAETLFRSRTTPRDLAKLPLCGLPLLPELCYLA